MKLCRPGVSFIGRPMKLSRPAATRQQQPLRGKRRLLRRDPDKRAPQRIARHRVTNLRGASSRLTSACSSNQKDCAETDCRGDK